jgi:hypothetical protein
MRLAAHQYSQAEKSAQFILFRNARQEKSVLPPVNDSHRSRIFLRVFSEFHSSPSKGASQNALTIAEMLSDPRSSLA